VYPWPGIAGGGETARSTDSDAGAVAADTGRTHAADRPARAHGPPAGAGPRRAGVAAGGSRARRPAGATRALFRSGDDTTRRRPRLSGLSTGIEKPAHDSGAAA